jgi:hypothetical protein
MAFGAALAGFAQGFLGGMKAGQDFQEGRERIQSRRELNRKAKNENDAADELAAVAKAQRQRGASTAATGGVTSQAIAAPTQALTPASAAQTPESTVAAAIPEAMYDDSEQSAYAEGGRVTRRTDAAHNTELSAQEQKAYDEWLRKQGRRADLEEQDYDMRGAYASGAAGDGRGHFPDTYKKPNHPTFSTQSQYHGQDGNAGGVWSKGPDGIDEFAPGPTNREHHTQQELEAYWRRAEPDGTSRMAGYAEGGVVRPEDQPPAAIPVAAPPAAAPPAQAITPPGNTPAAPAAPPANYNDPELKDKVPDPVTGGLDYMREAFGLNAAPAATAPGAAPAPAAAIPAPAQPGQPAAAVAPPEAAPDPQRMQRLTAMARGEGAASNEEVTQAAQRVDPKGEMTLAQRNTELLEAATNIYYSRGMIKEGNEAAASLLQNFRRNMQMYGGMAVAAAENGNMQQAGELLTQAYAYVPDGNTVTARRSGTGIELITIGPDGKPKPGREVNLADANAVRNAVGYSMDMDKWAGHLLNERKANAEIELGQGRLAETTRHNRAAEGLQGASLAESRAARGEARAARQRAEGRLVEGEAASTTARLAGIEADRAERALRGLGDDASPEDRQAAIAKAEAARDRARELEARVPTGLAARISSTENQDAQVDIQRERLRDAQAERALRQRAAAETDPLKKQKLEEEIRNLQARTDRTRAGPAGRAGAGALTFENRGKIDDAYSSLVSGGAGSLNPEQQEEGRSLSQTIAGLNPGGSATDYATAGLALRQGNFTVLRSPESSNPMVRIGARTYEMPPSMIGALMQYREQAKPPERTGPGAGAVAATVGSSIAAGPASVQRQREAAYADQPAATPRVPVNTDPMPRAVERLSTLFRAAPNMPAAQRETLIRVEAARHGVRPDALKQALGAPQ